MEVLVENTSKKSEDEYSGRNTQNMNVIFPKGDCKPGDYVMVRIERCTALTLIGTVVNN
jgi:tRNA-2-methylthio-N6-dimethylallyladenosine synthase